MDFYRSKKVFPSCFVCFALLISQLTKLFLPFDWKDLISRSLSKSRFVFVLSICFFILNLCFIRFSMSTNSHLSLVRGCTRNRTPTRKRVTSFSSYEHSLRELMGIEPRSAFRRATRTSFLHIASHPMQLNIFLPQASRPVAKIWWR